MSGFDWAMLPLQRYFQFWGRAPRAEYWWFTLLNIVLGFVAGLIDLALGLADPEAPFGVGTLVSLALFIPSLAVTTRRFHDINKPGWYMLIALLPICAIIFLLLTPVGWIMMLAGGSVLTFGFLGLVLLYTLYKYIGWMVTEGSRGDNLYGPSPYGYNYGVIFGPDRA